MLALRGKKVSIIYLTDENEINKPEIISNDWRFLAFAFSSLGRPRHALSKMKIKRNTECERLLFHFKIHSPSAAKLYS